jgi:uncharacterized protein
VCLPAAEQNAMNPPESVSFDEIDEFGPQSFTRTFDVTGEELDRPEVIRLGDVALEATADKGDAPGEYEIEGMVSFTADLTCSRCVDPFPFAISSPFHIRYRPRPEGSDGELEQDVEITSEEELDLEFYTERSVSLRDLAIQQIQLSLPMKPLCDEACLGLCAKCGANLRREECDCQSKPTDERWGVLQGLRDELAKKSEN